MRALEKSFERGRLAQAHLDLLASANAGPRDVASTADKLREAYLDYHAQRFWLKAVMASSMSVTTLCRGIRFLVESMGVIGIVDSERHTLDELHVDIRCAVRHESAQRLEYVVPDGTPSMQLGGSFVLGSCVAGPQAVLVIRIQVAERYGRALLRNGRALWLLRTHIDSLCPLHLTFRINVELSPHSTAFLLEDGLRTRRPAVLGLSTRLACQTAEA